MTRRDWLRGTAALALVGPLASCQTQAPGARFPQLTYVHLGTFRFDAARVEAASEYVPALRAPNVDHEFPVPPERVLRQWAADRLAANGAPGRYVQFVIRDAKVIETDLKRTPGLRGYFTTDQTQRYDLTLAAAVEVREERANLRAGFAEASSARSRTVREDLTVNERHKIWFEMMEQAMIDLNAELDRQIRTNLARFLIG